MTRSALRASQDRLDVGERRAAPAARPAVHAAVNAASPKRPVAVAVACS